MDDKEKQKDLERQKVLEQIRKRAEEAELRRIEEDEQRASSPSPAPPKSEAPKPPSPPPAAPRSQPASPPEPPPPPESEPLSPQEEKLKDLREKFSIAIDRGKLDKAQALFEELNPLLSDDDDIGELRARVDKLKKEQEAEAKTKKRAAEKQSKELSGKAREAEEKKIAALFEKANNFYQREKYDKAQETLNELFEINEDHDEAKELAENIAKSKELADRVSEDESRRKAEEAASAKPAPPPPPPVPQAPGDAWGNKKEVKTAEEELGLPPIGDAPKGPPKAPLMERLVERVANVRIPLKPVLIGIGAIILAASVYYIVDSLRQAVFPPKYSLLVLPALGTSGDSSSQYLAESVTEDLINAVGMVKDLRVIAPATTFSLSGYTGNISQVAHNLGASFFLQWTIVKIEDRIEFKLTLSDTMSSQPIWTSQRQNSMRELRSSVREIAEAIAAEMKIPFAPTEQEAPPAVMNTSGQAYELYAAGRWFLRQGDPESLNRALSSFTACLQSDSLFAEAHLGLAWTHLLALEQDDAAMLQHVNSAWKHLNTAFALGVRSAESYRIRGMVAQYQSQYDRAVEELERGVEFAPSDAETQRRLATLYVLRGRTDEALKAAMHAVADDSRNIDSYRLLGLIQLFRGEDKEALVSLEQGMRFAGDKSKYASEEYADALKYAQQSDRAANILEDRAVHTQYYAEYDKLGRLFQNVGRPKPQWEPKLQTARTLVKSAIAENPQDALAYSYLALVETRLGSFKNAIEASTRAQELAPSNLTVLYNTARMFALQNDKARAIDALRKAVDKRFVLTNILDMDFYNLHSDPEFQQAITR